MKEFRVRLVESITTEYKIQANNQQEAEEKMRELWEDCEVGAFAKDFEKDCKDQSVEWIEAFEVEY